MELAMLEEQVIGKQYVRYDEVFYPRTDKRSICKWLFDFWRLIVFETARINFALLLTACLV